MVICVKAVIFDVDGVIVDSETVYVQSFYNFFIKYKQNVEISEIHKTVGIEMKKTWEILGELWVPKLRGTEIKSMFEESEGDIFGNYKDLLMPHIHYVMRNLKQQKVKIGIASASSLEIIEKVLENCNLKQYISQYISGESVPQSKPHPGVYLEVMKKLEVEAKDTVIVEDSTAGITAGKAAGGTVIAMRDSRFNLDQSQADYLVGDHRESLAIINNLFKLEMNR